MLAHIDTALASANRGQGQLLLLTGEAGMGKTRTCREAAARAEAAGLRVVDGWCHELEGAPDLWPWLVALRQLLERADAPELAAGLGDGLAELAELLPTLRQLLPDSRAPRAPLEPESARFRRLETLVELLRRAARTAHWEAG